ncbi:MAG: hypothetical protein ACQEP3_03320 [Patescibacteria group bacterium]
MNIENKKLILPFGLIFILLIGGLIFFNETPENSDNETDEESGSTYTGNLIIGNPGLEEGWHISYEEEGSPGLIKKLSIPEDVNCIDSEDSCEKLLKEDDEIAGKRIIVEGEESDEMINVFKIEFLKEEGCNFDFSDFKTQTTLNNNYNLDFSTRPEAKDFRTKIQNAVDEGPNFAGNYVYAEWGCGTNCGAGAIINPKSGEVVEYGLVNTHGIKFKKDSKLLIINPPEEINAVESESRAGNVKSKYFIMEEDRLLLLCEKTI